MLVDRRKRRARRRMLFRLLGLLLLGAVAAGWWFWSRQDVRTPRFNSMLVNINGEPRRLLPGETLTLRPKDRVEISDISTSIPFDHNVRLASQGMDVNALQFEELPLVELLPRKDGFRRYEFRVYVKHLNQELGYVDWIVQPWAEDWLEKANRIIDDKKRLIILERGHEILPTNQSIEERLIQEYMHQKQWRKAIFLLEKKAARKNDVKILKALLSAYTALNDDKGIIEVLGRIVEQQPDDVEKRLQLAKILEKRGQLQEAILHYEAVLSKTPSDQGLALQKTLGFLYSKTGEVEKAIAAYSAAASLDQKDANLHYNLAELYERSGRQKEADFYLDNAVTLNAGDVEGRIKLAERLASRGSLKEARGHLEQVLRRNPDSRRALALLALILEKQGDKKALKQIYRQILGLEPENEAVSYNLGVLEYEDGNLDAALPYFESYGRNHLKDVTVQEILFDIYREQKENRKAYDQALVLVSLKPDDMGAYDFIFEYLTQKGDDEKLISVLRKAVAQNPKEAKFRRNLLSIYVKKGEQQEAIREFETLISQKKDVSDAVVQDMFDMLAGEKKYQDIIRIMKKVVSAQPDNIVAREYLIFAYLETGDESSAITEMENILKKTPNNLKLALQLARLAEKKNQIKKAVKAYKKVLELSPEHPEASEAYLRLRLKGVGVE